MRTWHRFWRYAAACLLLLVMSGQPARAADSDDEIVAKINKYLKEGWDANNVTPSPRALDGEFARRATLDIVGRIPPYETLAAFLNDSSPNKRAKFVDALLDDPDYLKNWTNIWANMLVGRRNNRGGNRESLERWLRASFYKNQAYNKFVFDLVAAEGSSEDNGAVNFLSSHLNDGAVPATAVVSRVFLGMQVQCTQCHNHPFNDWKQAQFWSMNAFFRGTRSARGEERGQFRLSDEPVTSLIFFERRNGLQEAVQRKFVDGTLVDINDDVKPRRQLAEVMTDPTKPFVARTQVNRIWGHLLGSGFTRPVDDMGPHNAPSHPELLDYLADQFTRAGYDNKRLIRWVALSEAYQLTSRMHKGNEGDDPATGATPFFSRTYIKPFTAEQLYDSLIIATEAHKARGNAEAAESQRRAWLGQFVRTFGTDDNEETTSFNGTIPQALTLMNGDLVRTAVSDAKGSFLHRLLENDNLPVVPNPHVTLGKTPTPSGAPKSTGATTTTPGKTTPPTRPGTGTPKTGTAGTPKTAGTRPVATPAPKPLTVSQQAALEKKLRTQIDILFLASLARHPNEEELQAVNKIFHDSGIKDPIIGLQDLFWALLNSNEFIINH